MNNEILCSNTNRYMGEKFGNKERISTPNFYNLLPIGISQFYIAQSFDIIYHTDPPARTKDST